ncbi:hypothetical protein [Winogradskyella haliclonae]|uniref:Uncharacterized protein n=1 Tax=Winogradskyella haliclonae TaxID=2048558 RepID=A0ABQ2BZF4_9FLAO|nr:hypothetical protein [Winogradskyella haliclonae]GGI56883.1 hypothetical protein GCM10011444_11920 [Winogradskyella haliclonae]
MIKILRKFISYFIISGLVYYSFLVVETISLYFSEFGFDLTNGMLFSFSQIPAVINFGVFIALILVTAELIKEKIPFSKFFQFGLIISLIFGGLIFLLSNSVVPKIRMKSFLDRYENARKEPFTSQERIEKATEYKKTNVDMMSIGHINQYSDSLETKNKSQKKIISDLFKKIPDSIIQSDFSKTELNEYGISKNELTTEFNRRDLFQLKNEIRKNTLLKKQFKKSNWTKNTRYLNSFLTLFLVCFAIVIGVNFKNQLIFSLVCIGIVIYSQTLTLLTTSSDYFINEDNLLGLIFKFTIILVVFLYLVYRMKTKKNTGANNVYSS